MKSVLQTIRILVLILLIERAYCQDGFSEQDLLRFQQMSANAGQGEPITSYNNNALQRDPNSQSNLIGAQYQVQDNANGNEDYSRTERGRSRKVYRIKNPFQQQSEEDGTSQENNSQDSGTAASNQYAAMQYSLPPEEFLQQMRAENQYHQQQQQQQQQQPTVSPSPYTATPQPQYQYSTISALGYDSSQAPNQVVQEAKAYTPAYPTHVSPYQYNNQNTFNVDTAYSTPLPSYLSTSLPNTNYLGTPANTYISSSSPLYLSSPQNIQQYVSSPLSSIQSGIDYSNNNRGTTAGSNSVNYENNEVNKRRQIDHYDNSGNGIRYYNSPYQNEFPSSTISPSSSPFSDLQRDTWLNNLNSGLNGVAKTEQNYPQAQYQNFKYNNNNHQQEYRQEQSVDSNSDTHRIGSVPSANNVYLNFVQPDYQVLNNLKSRSRESEQETSQSEVYSHGDYGWKLTDKKSPYGPEVSTNTNYFSYQMHSMQPDTGAVSQVNFHMDSGKQFNYDQTKPVTEKIDAQEFVRAAAKAHENYKQQLEASKYSSNNQYNNNIVANSLALNSYYNQNEKQRNKYSDGPSSYGNSQSDLVTASPFYYINQRDTLDNKGKLPFDHDKALKNIVPIDVSNVVQNTDSSTKSISEYESNNRYIHNYNKDDFNLKQFSRNPSESYYKDKNTLYTLNIKSKPDDLVIPDKYKQLEQSISYYSKPSFADSIFNYGNNSSHKRFVDDSSQSFNFPQNQMSNTHSDSAQSSANLHQQGQQRPQFSSDINNLLKFGDIPYRLTQSLNADNLRLNNFDQGSLPNTLPIRINQNVDNHHLDVTSEILSKLMANKQNLNLRPENDPQSGNLISTINGFKVANPFNVDLKLVSDMLKGKAAVDDSQMTTLRDFNKPLPMKIDISQLQQFLQLKNENNPIAYNNNLGSLNNPYFDIFNGGRFPYQGVKYSRSEEEAENIPIADASSNHPIGAVVEQEESVNIPEVTEEVHEDNISSNLDDERSKSIFSTSHRVSTERHRHPTSMHPTATYPGRHNYNRKYPVSEYNEPYPLLKPPLPQSSRHRAAHTKLDKNSYRRRAKPKMLRFFKTEPLYEAGSTIVEDIEHPSHFRRSLSVAEDKSDIININEST